MLNRNNALNRSRYRLARLLIHAGLFVWPDGRAKREVLLLLWEWRHHLDSEVASAADLDIARSPTNGKLCTIDEVGDTNDHAQ